MPTSQSVCNQLLKELVKCSLLNRWQRRHILCACAVVVDAYLG